MAGFPLRSGREENDISSAQNVRVLCLKRRKTPQNNVKRIRNDSFMSNVCELEPQNLLDHCRLAARSWNIEFSKWEILTNVRYWDLNPGVQYVLDKMGPVFLFSIFLVKFSLLGYFRREAANFFLALFKTKIAAKRRKILAFFI